MKMRTFLTILLALMIVIPSSVIKAQEQKTAAKIEKTPAAATQEKVKLYDPTLDGMKQIKEATAKAKAAGKHVLVQYGGNWCGWCIKFDAFCKADTLIMKTINDNYIPIKLNYDSNGNRNDEANVYMGNPTRFGFPVFIIIDGNGKILHIQDSGLLEEGAGYNKQKVLGFFRNWTTKSIVPVQPKKLPVVSAEKK